MGIQECPSKVYVIVDSGAPLGNVAFTSKERAIKQAKIFWSGYSEKDVYTLDLDPVEYLLKEDA